MAEVPDTIKAEKHESYTSPALDVLELHLTSSDERSSTPEKYEADVAEVSETKDLPQGSAVFQSRSQGRAKVAHMKAENTELLSSMEAFLRTTDASSSHFRW